MTSDSKTAVTERPIAPASQPIRSRTRKPKPVRYQTPEESCLMCEALADVTDRLHRGGVKFVAIRASFRAPDWLSVAGGGTIQLSAEQQAEMPRELTVSVDDTSGEFDDDAIRAWELKCPPKNGKQPYRLSYC